MKFVIAYDMRNIFLENSHTKCGGEASPRPFYKKMKIELIWINSLKFQKVYFHCMSKSKSTKIF